MNNILEIKEYQLKEKIAQIVPFDYVAQRKDEHVFIVYIAGTIPIMVKSKLTFEQFCKIC